MELQDYLSNLLLSKIAEWYVEIFRNVPLLLQLFFWYFAVLRALPIPKESVHLFDFFILNIKGLYIPEFIWTNFNALFYSLVRIYSFYRIIYCLGQKSTREYRKTISQILNFIRCFVNCSFFERTYWRC